MRKKKIPANVQKVMSQYQDLHTKLFGAGVEFKYDHDTKWISISDKSERVTYKRLKEMVRQFTYRLG